MNQIKDDSSSNISIILVANKIDCENEFRQVTKEEGEVLAKNNNLPIFEASAKDNINVEESFKYLIEEINKKISHFTVQTTTKLNNDNKNIKQEKKGCC